MANTGELVVKSTTKKQGQFILSFTQTIDKNNNQSKISFSFKTKSTYITAWAQMGTLIKYSIKVGGESYSGYIPAYYGRYSLADYPEYDGYEPITSEKTIETGTITIAHNNAGEATLNLSISVTDNSGETYTCGNASGSKNFILNSIPRASTFTISKEAYVEDNVSVTITPSDSDFYHKIQWYLSQDIIDNNNKKRYTGKQWTVAATLAKGVKTQKIKIRPEFYNLFKSTTNPKLKFRCVTYNSNDKVVGTSSEKEVTLKINNSKTLPIIKSIEIEEKWNDYRYGQSSNGKTVVSSSLEYISGTVTYDYSKDYKTFKVYNSTGKFSPLVGGNSKAGMGIEGNNQSEIKFDSTKRNFIVKYKDSYGKTSVETKFSNDVFETYFSPKITVSKVNFSFSTENVNEKEKYVITDYDFKIDANYCGYKKAIGGELTNENNKLTIKYYIGTNPDAEITDQAVHLESFNSNTYNYKGSKTINLNNSTEIGINFDSLDKATFYLKVWYSDDKTNSYSSASTQTLKLKPLFDWDNNNFQFNIPVYINNSLIMPNNSAYSLATKTGGSLNMNNGDIIKANRVVFADYADGDVSEGLIFPREDNSNKFDCLRVRDRNIRVLPNYDGGTTIPAEDIYYPGHNGGDSVTFSNNSAQWAGHITGGSKLIYFTIPFNRPIITSTNKISISGQVVIRTIQGYGFVKEQGTTNAEINLTGSGVTTTVASRSGSGISVLIKATNPFQTSSGGELSNNRPLTVETAGVTVTFSK